MGKKFVQQRSEAVNRYNMSLKAGDVDPELKSLLDFINSLEDFYTTSSCAGRIALFLYLGGKDNDRFLGKWHRKVSFEEVSCALEASKGTTWFRYEPMILHVVARTLEGAKKLLDISHGTGFKRAGIRGIKEERFMVEICSTEKIDTPVMRAGKMLVPEDYLKVLVEIANEKFDRGHEKLKRLEKDLMELEG